MKKEIPILFSTDMVEAILAGRKAMTRREVKPRTPEDFALMVNMNAGIKVNETKQELIRCSCRYGKPGDLLWVRETWAALEIEDELVCGYKASMRGEREFDFIEQDGSILGLQVERWRPSIHMPKIAARIWLEITGSRVERLQDISEDDAIAEGIEPAESFDSGEGVYPGKFFKNYLPHGYTEVKAKDSFQSLWQKINGEESWEQNPWVWVITFKVLSTTGKPKNIELCKTATEQSLQ